MAGGTDDPIQALELRIQQGEIDRNVVERARAIWLEELASGVYLPNGERIEIWESDLFHILQDDRLLRRPERIERILHHITEIRTARMGRRRGLSSWVEGDITLYGYAILDIDQRVRTMHVIDERKARKQARQGERLWLYIEQS